ncbi:MAG: peptidylprolyl isomerase [Bacteriovoracaceae bacterium]|nr:peptidylprolyl isomerase [Bacteriovoracaceae bacterium]
MKKLLLIFLSVSAVSLFAIAQNKTNEIAATVNGINIHVDELDAYYKENLFTASNRIVTLETSLDELINRQLGIEKAKKTDLQNDPVVKKKMEDVLFHAQISKDLENELKKIAPTISDSDVKKYYDENKEYRTSHILFRVRALPSPEEVKTAYDQSIRIYTELKDAPQKFEEVAKKYSQSTVAQTGGDLGYLPPTGLSPQYFEAIKGRSVGQVVGPVRTQFGVHVIKITGVKEYSEINKDVYKKILYDQKRDKVIADYFKKLRADAKVTINKQFLK